MRRSRIPCLASALILGATLLFAGARHASAQTTIPSVEAPPAAATAAPGQRLNVVVQLSNGTPGSAVPANIPVKLYAYDGQAQSFTLDGTENATGNALFEGVPYKNGRAYGVTATIGRTTYFTPLTPPLSGSSELNLPLTIYDTTTDASQVRINQMYVLGENLDETHLRVTNAYVLSNGGSRTVEGGEVSADGEPATLRFDLPAGAAQIEYQAEDREAYLPADGGFVYTRGVPPGQATYRITVRYILPYSGQLRLDLSVRYPADAVTVLWADRGMKLAGGTLKEQGTQSGPDGTTYRVYAADPVKAGAAFGFDLSGTPRLGPAAPIAQPASQTSAPVQSTAASRPPDTVARLLATLQDTIGPGLLVSLFGIAVMIASAIHWLFRRRAARLAREPGVRQRTLVQAMVDLEEDYDAGRVTQEDYQGRLERLREALVALTEYSEPLYETAI